MNNKQNIDNCITSYETIPLTNIEEFENNIKQIEEIHPEIKYELDFYIGKIHNIQNKSYYLTRKNIDSQFFTQDYNMLGLTFTLTFSIDKAEQIIKEKNIPITSIPTNSINLSKSEININKIKALSLQSEHSPIIIAYNFINETLIIDGIHRTYIAQNKQQQNISAYILSFEETLDCLVSDYHRILYIISYNLDKILNLLKEEKIKYIHYTDKKTKYGIIQTRTNRAEIKESKKQLSNINVYKKIKIVSIILAILLAPPLSWFIQWLQTL